MNLFTRSAVAIAITCAAGCGNAAERAATPFTGSYAGTVSARVAQGHGKAQSGTASATFAPSGGRDRLEVKASIRRANDSGFVVHGRPVHGGWQGRGGPLSLVVDRAGRITGGGIEKGHRIGFSGQLDAGRMTLTVETVQLAPPGERIVFEYRLTRPAPAGQVGATAAGRAQATGACRRRVWRTRNVAAPGGGMVMTQVPHCLD
ncbi:hypothetical protein H5368_10055 [Luteimonas sp. MC1782]|uniref:hypothetical protein n=1 Tax=Luteimonas sp. MC1782 TaxID=2760305 RepID=UPI0016027E18|nr:hypothetical protein [Luteimonas sp. MC1782]MBB1473377.1 hypothetical protein [Luteimonas sp. MC1782]